MPALKEKRFSLAARLLGGFCALGLISVLIVVALAGFSLFSGTLLVASVSGLAVPCVMAGGSLLDMLEALFDLILEGLGTLVEIIADVFASILASIFG
ncbi:MAG: hypothetical protein ACK5PG_01165 [Lysobacterales bacterium]|jgi:hypothetical protein